MLFHTYDKYMCNIPNSQNPRYEIRVIKILHFVSYEYDKQQFKHPLCLYIRLIDQIFKFK